MTRKATIEVVVGDVLGAVELKANEQCSAMECAALMAGLCTKCFPKTLCEGEVVLNPNGDIPKLSGIAATEGFLA